MNWTDEMKQDYDDLIREITRTRKRAMELASRVDGHENESKNVLKLKIKPLIFASRRFTKNQLKWHIHKRNFSA